MTLKNTFFKLIDNEAFAETMENEGMHSDIKLVTTNKKIKLY